jgi:tetratricopeptide (TPR) repeat protein
VAPARTVGDIVTHYLKGHRHGRTLDSIAGELRSKTKQGSDTSLSAWAHGRRVPDIKQLRALRRIVGCRCPEFGDEAIGNAYNAAATSAASGGRHPQPADEGQFSSPVQPAHGLAGRLAGARSERTTPRRPSTSKLLAPGPGNPQARPLPRDTGRLPPRYLHGVPLPRNWADRSDEVRHFSRRLADRDTRVLNIVALGGTGKSTLLRKVADHIFEDVSRYDALFWFSFYREEDVERFFLEACRYLVPGFDPATHESTFERAILLQEITETRSALIVLDGFERVVTVRAGRRGADRISRREVSTFLAHLMSSRSGTAVAITSRVRLDEFADVSGFVEEELADLKPAAAVAFLRGGGLKGSDRALRRVADAYGRHALALTVFIDYVRFRGAGNRVNLVDAPMSFPPESTRAERLNALLDHYSVYLTDAERCVLNLIATSVRGLTREELGELLGQAPDGVDGLRSLGASNLATLHQDGDILRFDSHPLIKGHFYDELPADERRGMHQRLLALAQAKPVAQHPAAIDEIQPLLDTFGHAAAIGEVETAFATWQDRRVRNRLLWWGSYQTALDLVDRLLTVPAFRSRSTAFMQGFLLDQAGMLLVKIGQPADAVDSYREAVDCLEEHSERQLQTLLHLCETQIEVGLFLDARESLRRATDLFATVPGFPRFRLVGRKGYLATALDSAGHAEALLTQAIREAGEQEGEVPGYRCLFLRIRGDLHCAHDRLDLAEADYGAALALATDERWRFTDYEGHLRRGLGEVACRRLRYAEAKAHFAAALDIARRLGYRWLETETFVAQARCALRAADIDAAETDATTAHDLAQAGGWVALQADSLLVLAECLGSCGLPTDEMLTTAGGLIARSGSRPLKARYAQLSGKAG